MALRMLFYICDSSTLRFVTHGGEKYTQTLRWWDKFLAITLPKTNIAPENGWLEDEMSYWEGLFSGDI